MVIAHAGVATVGDPNGLTDTVKHIVVELACTQSYTFDFTVLAAWLLEGDFKVYKVMAFIDDLKARSTDGGFWTLSRKERNMFSPSSMECSHWT